MITILYSYQEAKTVCPDNGPDPADEEITQPGCGCQTRHGHGMNDAPELVQMHWPVSGCQNCRIGTQSRIREIKHLASTGPNLGTETEPTPPALGHNHVNQNGTLSRHWSNTGCWNWADTGSQSCSQLAGTSLLCKKKKIYIYIYIYIYIHTLSHTELQVLKHVY